MDGAGPFHVAHLVGGVPEDLHPADHGSLFVPKGRNTDLDRNLFAIPVMGKDQNRDSGAGAGDNGPVHGAMLLAAELVAHLVGMAEDVVVAGASHHLRGLPAGDPLGRLVPIDNAPVQIGNIHPVV